jgi:general stress protein 13
MAEYKKGQIVKCNITGVENYGIFVNLDNYYSGLIHISEISKDFVKNVNDYGEVGETIYVKILDVDEKLNQVKLSIKDIDYRIKNNNKNKGIKEIGQGFGKLEDNLQKWIDEKLKEIH